LEYPITSGSHPEAFWNIRSRLETLWTATDNQLQLRNTSPAMSLNYAVALAEE